MRKRNTFILAVCTASIERCYLLYLMKQATFWIVIVAMSLTWSCYNTTDPDSFVDSADADANALTEVLIMPSAADLDTGTPPAPSAIPTAPTINNNNPTIQSANGSTTRKDGKPISF